MEEVVFFAVSQSVPFLDMSVTTNAEMVWVKISLERGDPILICSFYRPPDTNDSPIEELRTALSSISTPTNANII